MKILKKMVLASLVVSLFMVFSPMTAAGTPVPNGGACSVSGGVVSATGLPTDRVINIFVTTDAGKEGWVLGFSDDGTWTTDISAFPAPGLVEFASKTYGNDGKKYRVYAACTY